MTNIPNAEQNQRLVLVTGPSGAGRSTAIKVLEDVGFETIDNLPLGLVSRLFSGPPLERPLALGLDTRNRDFSASALLDLMHALRAHAPELLYLDCSPAVLQRRYSETRRRHPLAPAESVTVGIEREQELLAPIRASAHVLIDTSDLNVHGLRDTLEHQFAPRGGKFLAVTLTSFSYKRGVPLGADMVQDCRFLQNPYWDPSLRAFDGRDQAVAEFVAKDERFEEFFDRLRGLISFLLPAYRAEGKAHLNIALGCTGGQHRSVFVTEKLAQALAQAGWQVSIRHRELDRREGRSASVQKAAGSKEAKA
ncbi:RNase adapter RapZ [Cognatishimia sp. SS12]|uniref:RNase adapter RapZ n=1 Tax=Cognatishimia sp. SS12 TaxID=2979465 RepID=UPI00232F9EA6|nr:RNase adapter RapZ [Cognatishimia sp. SS12]MDC0738425.1 RNase adapter RapZ [Cognatishimia sp. SS12]